MLGFNIITQRRFNKLLREKDSLLQKVEELLSENRKLTADIEDLRKQNSDLRMYINKITQIKLHP